MSLLRHPHLKIPHTYDPLLKKLTIRESSIFPEEVLSIADDVEVLDMSFGSMTELPDSFAGMYNLKVVFFSYNDFEEVPEILGKCTKLVMIGAKSCKISKISPRALPVGLQALVLTDNCLEALPASIGNLTNLKKITLTGNQLHSLPREILACQNLELIRIAANRFSILPDWLMELPQLAWYTDAGNPGSQGSSTDKDEYPSVSWSDITVGEKLGESFKNIVYEGWLNDSHQEVAVKMYGGEITADGNSLDDIHASIVAGSHQNIIASIGKLEHAPDNKLGLVMKRIPKEFKTLANPPTLVTLTRDVYSKDQTFSLSFIVAALQGIAGAIQHLHGQGVMHGDIYAHNILVNNSGRPFLGDFGASSIYNPMLSKKRELVDVRAFTHLMGELLSRCNTNDRHNNKATIEQLLTLGESILHPSKSLSPAEMYDTINSVLKKQE